jgi:hypothetical protein
VSFTDKDMELLNKLAEVAKMASNATLYDFINANDAAGLLMYAEVAAGSRTIMYHIAEVRKVDRTELWDTFDI